MTKKSITPEQELKVMITVVEAMTAAEAAGIRLTTGPRAYDTEGRYTIEWDSKTDRWTLVAETDDAIEVCSFNSTEGPDRYGVCKCLTCQTARYGY
jgi:hypothetical protein